MADKLAQLAKEKKKLLKKTEMEKLKAKVKKEKEVTEKEQRKEEEEIERMIQKENAIIIKAVQKRGIYTISKYTKEISTLSKKIENIDEKVKELSDSIIASKEPEKIRSKISSLEKSKNTLLSRKNDLEKYILKLEKVRKGEDRGVKVERLTKLTQGIDELSDKAEVLEAEVLELSAKRDEIDGKDDKSLEKVKKLEKKIKTLSDERTRTLFTRSEMMNEMLEIEEEELITDDETKVLTLIKDLVQIRDKALSEGKKVSVNDILEKLLDFQKSNALSDDNKKIFERLFELKKNELINFLNLYLKKESNFFEFLPEYLGKLKNKTKDQLQELSKDQLLGLLKESKFPGDYKNKNKEFLIGLLLKKRCDPDLEIFCPEEDNVCNIVTETCEKRPTEIKGGWSIQLYKGQYLYGPYRKVTDYISRLKDLIKLERDRLNALKVKRKIPFDEDKKVSKMVTKLVNIILVDGKEVFKEVPLIQREDNYKFQVVNSLIGKNCIKDYETKPWVENYESTWIVNTDGSRPSKKYITDEEVEYKNNTYYKTNKVFEMMNCNKYYNQRNVKDNILKIYDENGIEHNFMVIYRLNNGNFKVQTEDLFKREKEWLNLNVEDFKAKVKYYLGYQFVNSELNAVVRSLMLGELENLLKNISGSSKIENKHKQIAEAIEAAVRDRIGVDNTIEDYIRMMANIIVFLDERSKLYNFSKSFAQKVINTYYNFNKIPELENTEKLKGIFSNPSISDLTKANLSSIIGEEIERKVLETMRKLFMTLDPTRKTMDFARFLDPVDYSRVQSILKNPIKPTSLEVSDKVSKEGFSEPYADWEYEYYSEGGDVYAITVYTLLENFLNGNYINPFTNKPFSNEFITEILDKYDMTNMIFGGPIQDLTGEEEELLEEEVKRTNERDLKKQELEDLVFNVLEDAIILDEGGVVIREIPLPEPEEEEEIKIEELEEKELAEEPEEIEVLDIEDSYSETREDKRILLNSFHKYLEYYFDVDDLDRDRLIEEFLNSYGDSINYLIDFYNFIQTEEKYDNIGIYDAEEIIQKFENNEGKDDKGLCDYCDKKLEDEIFKTSVKKNKGSEIIKFCSLKCFEDSPFRKRK